MNRMRPPRWRLAAASAAFVLLPPWSAFSQDAAEAVEDDISEEEILEAALDEAKTVRERGNVEGVASQKRIDAISDETETLFARYSNTLRQIDSIRIYNNQLRELIASQEMELASLRDQLDRVEIVGRSVTPLMLRMIAALDALVELDLPYLIEERTQRIADLRKLMNRADVTSAEKYRRIMEAYQTENEYGRTIEAYRSTIRRGDRDVKVDFLRFGRIALVYQTLDGMEAGVWNQAKRAWEPLDASYRTAIREGLRIARKQAAPDLIRLPLPVPETAERGQG
jgi:hypothetical protein